MLEQILRQLEPTHTRLVAISKTKPPEQILELYRKGHKIFGENKVQELLPKYEALPKDIEWHLVGRLQSNKVKYIAPFIACIHSVDNLKLLQEIDKRAKQHQRTIDCLLQFHICDEQTKHGMTLEEAESILHSPELPTLANARITGVMGMATFTDDMEKVRLEFRNLKSIFDLLKNRYFPYTPWFSEISMGMSADYLIAIQEGSTMVRIGTLLFGERE